MGGIRGQDALNRAPAESDGRPTSGDRTPAAPPATVMTYDSYWARSSMPWRTTIGLPNDAFVLRKA
jgi:hypothetical protein